MRLNNYIKDTFLSIEGCIILTSETNESISNDTIKALNDIGRRIGVKVKRTDSLLDYLKGAEKGTEELLRLAALYGMTDIKDKESRKELKSDMANVLKRINRKNLVGFFMRLDKTAFHLTSIPRHVLSALFGIDVKSKGYWQEDKDYLEKEMRHIRVVLKRMGDMTKELSLLDKLEQNILTKGM